MSIILGDYSKKKTSNISLDGSIQSLPPENDIPSSWAAHDHRIYAEKKRLGEITEWRNEEGDLTHFTEKKIIKGKKILLPFTYWVKTIEGKIVGLWKTTGWLGKKCFHKSNKIQQSDLPLLVSEGEKCMHFAETNSFLSKHYLSTTWFGGVKNLYQFNFEIFKDKEVILCPDNDGPGRKAMHEFAYQLVTKGITENIKYFNIAEKFKELFPSAWDIADEFPDNYTLEKALEPGSMFIANFKDVRDDKLWNEIEAEEQKREEKETAEEISKSLGYVMSNDMFNKLGTSDFYLAKQLNNFHKHQVKNGNLTDILLKDPNFTKAETFVTSAKHPPGIINITRPGIIPLINKGKVLNIYIPNYITEKEGDIKFLIEFFIWLIGKDKWIIIEQWIAYHLKYPGEKRKWAVVLVSAIEGTGKGLLARVISRVLGADNVNENANYKHLNNTHSTLLIGTQVLVLNEVSLGDFKGKAEGTNTLKNFIGDDIYTCNFKGKPMVKLPNLTNFVLFSNDVRVLGVSQGVRRYFFCNLDKTEEEIMEKDTNGLFKKLWDFADSDAGAAALLHHFNRVAIPNPEIFKKRAPETEDLKQLIEQSKHPIIKKLEWDLNRPDMHKKKIFGNGWCGLITFDELNDKLNTQINDTTTDRFDWGTWGDDALYKFLATNCTRWNSGETTRQISINGPTKLRFYIIDDTRCPLPNKSYKDLTPKQIEHIHQNYLEVLRKVYDEKPDHNYAITNEPSLVVQLKDKIKSWCDPGKYGDDKFKGRDPEEVFSELMDGTLKIENNDHFLIDNVIRCKRILKTGIREPEQILTDLTIGDKGELHKERVIVESKEFSL